MRSGPVCTTMAAPNRATSSVAGSTSARTLANRRPGQQARWGLSGHSAEAPKTGRFLHSLAT